MSNNLPTELNLRLPLKEVYSLVKEYKDEELTVIVMAHTVTLLIAPDEDSEIVWVVWRLIKAIFHKPTEILGKQHQIGDTYAYLQVFNLTLFDGEWEMDDCTYDKDCENLKQTSCPVVLIQMAREAQL